MTNFADLRSLVSSPVFLPGDDGYVEEVAAFAMRHVHTPDAAVGVTSPTDVVETVRFARDHNVPVRVQSTGHGASAPIDSGILVTTKRLDSVAIDPEGRTATIGGGVRWAAVVEAAAEHGLTPVVGSSSNVGAVGYLLGGGIGPLVRSHGMSSDYVVSFEVVTGHGELVTASAAENPELYWALRGGKGGLGIVTEAKIRLVELNALYAGGLMFEGPHIESVLRAWVDFTATAPENVTTSIVIIRFPDLEQVPPPMRGTTMLSLRFAFPGDPAEGEAIAAPLRAAAPVFMDGLGPLPAADIALIHNDPTEPGPSWVTAAMLTDIDQDFASALLAQVGYAVETPLVVVEVRHIGGAGLVDVQDDSATGGRAANYTLGVVAMAPIPELVGPITAAADRLYDSVESWLSEEFNVNFIGYHLPEEERYVRAWSPETYARLAVVREEYDPQGLFPYGH